MTHLTKAPDVQIVDDVIVGTELSFTVCSGNGQPLSPARSAPASNRTATP